VVAVTLRYYTEFGKHVLQKTICDGIYARLLLYFVVHVQRRRKKSSRSLSHLLMSFLYALPAWEAFLSVDRINGFFKGLKRYGYINCYDC